MITATIDEQKKAKLRFLLLYVSSLALIFLIVIAFWQNHGSEAAQNIAGEISENESYFIQLDTMLHAKMDQLDQVYADYLQSNRAEGGKELTELLSMKYIFTATLDRISQQASILNAGIKKDMMTLIVSKFSNSFEARSRMINELAQLPANEKNTLLDGLVKEGRPEITTEEMEEIKGMLVEKEEKITALENKVQKGLIDKASVIAKMETQKQKELAEKDRLISSLQNGQKQKGASLQRTAIVTQNKQ
jgi:hypothetical protein